MSVTEDTRKVLQDFIAPELRAIHARLSAVEKRLDGIGKRFDKLEEQLDERFEKWGVAMDKRFDQITFEIRRLTDFHEMELRVARIETELKKRNLSSDSSSSEAA